MEIPTLDGKVDFKVPAGTQAGSVFRLKGKGIPRLEGHGRGEQFVTVILTTPRSLDGYQRELLQALGETFDGKTSASKDGNEGIFERIKDRFGGG